MRRVLTRTAQEEPTPPDHCYVHNFADPYRPTALELPAGRGRELARGRLTTLPTRRRGRRRVPGECRRRRVDAAARLSAGSAAAAHERQSAVVVPADPLFNVQAHEIANFALRYKLPTAFSQSSNVDAGGLLSYGASIADSFRRGAAYVDKIIKGAKPGELPVEQVTIFETVINLKTAKALGLKIPQSVLLRADRVIE